MPVYNWSFDTRRTPRALYKEARAQIKAREKERSDFIGKHGWEGAPDLPPWSPAQCVWQCRVSDPRMANAWTWGASTEHAGGDNAIRGMLRLYREMELT